MARLNWALLHWRSKANVLTIGLGRADHEVWTGGSLRVAVWRMITRGNWNPGEEATASCCPATYPDPSPRELYRSLPLFLVGELLRSEQSVVELGEKLRQNISRLAGLQQAKQSAGVVVPSGLRLTSAELAWLVFASASHGCDLHLYPKDLL